MPLFGAHMSIAGGYHNALMTAQKHQCATVQLFTKNNNQWQGKPLAAAEVTTLIALRWGVFHTHAQLRPDHP